MDIFDFGSKSIVISENCPKCGSTSLDWEPDFREDKIKYSCYECGNKWSE